MSLLISVAVAIALVFGLGYAAPYLPYNHLIGGNLYQIVGIILAVVISAALNMPMLYMLRANSTYKKGKYKEGLALYKKAYKTKRISADMEIFCGYVFLKEGEKALAAEVFEKLESKEDKLTERQKNNLHTNKSILLWKNGDVNGAVELLKQVWERENSVTVAGTLGALMLIAARDSGDYSEALDFCTATNEQYTYEKTILANLVEAYYCTNQNDKAVATFRELLDCGCSSPAPYYHGALALLKAGEAQEAEEMLNRALRLRFSHLATISKKTVKAKLAEISQEQD